MALKLGSPESNERIRSSKNPLAENPRLLSWDARTCSGLAEHMTQALPMYLRDCVPAAAVLQCAINGIRVSFVTLDVVYKAPLDDC